eukprot:2139297-Alexandrium_andersonii.AAC.2
MPPSDYDRPHARSVLQGSIRRPIAVVSVGRFALGVARLSSARAVDRLQGREAIAVLACKPIHNLLTARRS